MGFKKKKQTNKKAKRKKESQLGWLHHPYGWSRVVWPALKLPNGGGWNYTQRVWASSHLHLTKRVPSWPSLFSQPRSGKQPPAPLPFWSAWSGLPPHEPLSQPMGWLEPSPLLFLLSILKKLREGLFCQRLKFRGNHLPFIKYLRQNQKTGPWVRGEGEGLKYIFHLF